MGGTQARTHVGNAARESGLPPPCAAVALQSAPQSWRFQAVAQRSIPLYTAESSSAPTASRDVRRRGRTRRPGGRHPVRRPHRRARGTLAGAGDGTLRGPGVWSTGAPPARGQAEASAPVGRRWLRDAKRRLEEKRAAEARPIPRSRSERVRESKRRLEEEHRVECRANEAYDAYRARGVMRDGRPRPAARRHATRVAIGRSKAFRSSHPESDHKARKPMGATDTAGTLSYEASWTVPGGGRPSSAEAELLAEVGHAKLRQHPTHPSAADPCRSRSRPRRCRAGNEALPTTEVVVPPGRPPPPTKRGNHARNNVSAGCAVSLLVPCPPGGPVLFPSRGAMR
jgi:hypothetical protein